MNWTKEIVDSLWGVHDVSRLQWYYKRSDCYMQNISCLYDLAVILNVAPFIKTNGLKYLYKNYRQYLYTSDKYFFLSKA